MTADLDYAGAVKRIKAQIGIHSAIPLVASANSLLLKKMDGLEAVSPVNTVRIVRS